MTSSFFISSIICITSHISAKDKGDSYTNTITRTNWKRRESAMLQWKTPASQATVVIAGELDHFAAPQIRRMLDEVLDDESITHLTLDLENLTFMDSSGIGVLLGRLRILQNRGGSLSVKNMQPPVEKLFRLSGLQRVIGVEQNPKGGRL